MTPEQTQTFVIGLVATAVLGGLWFAVITWREVRTLRNKATFSDALTAIWALQPWAILLPSLVGSFILGFFFGHWFGVPADYLAQIREAVGGSR